MHKAIPAISFGALAQGRPTDEGCAQQLRSTTMDVSFLVFDHLDLIPEKALDPS